MSCRICEFWNYETRISVNTFIDYALIYNIANIFQDRYTCDDTCSRFCCQPEIVKFLRTHHPIETYQKIVDDALDLRVYYPNIYAKALISESKLGESQLMEQFLSDSVFDNSLNRQKLRFMLENKDTLDRKGLKTLDLLKFQSKYDNFSYKYKRIFGNKLQILCLGLMDDEKRLEMLKKYYGRRIENQIVAFLHSSVIEQFLESKNEDIKHISLAKLPIDRKLELLKTDINDKDRIALLHDLDQDIILTLLNAVLKNLDTSEPELDLPTSSVLKLIGQVEDKDLLLSMINHPDPHVIAGTIYNIHARYNETFEKMKDRIRPIIRTLIERHNIFLPVQNLQQMYYEILMDNPTHTLSGFLVNYLTDKILLKKLMFHTNLRPKIKERVKFLKHS